jgi:hypothetical protein
MDGKSTFSHHETVIIDSKTKEPSSNEGSAGVGLVRQDETGCEAHHSDDGQLRQLILGGVVSYVNADPGIGLKPRSAHQ